MLVSTNFKNSFFSYSFTPKKTMEKHFVNIDLKTPFMALT
jgi:hypothetical protein